MRSARGLVLDKFSRVEAWVLEFLSNLGARNFFKATAAARRSRRFGPRLSVSAKPLQTIPISRRHQAAATPAAKSTSATELQARANNKRRKKRPRPEPNRPEKICARHRSKPWRPRA